MLYSKYRMYLVLFVVIALALILSLAAAPKVATAAPPSMPNDVQMVQPASSLPKELAAFAGKWEGSGYDTAQGQIELFLIVEKIVEDKASLYTWHSVHGWNRREAAVTTVSGKYELWYDGPYGKVVITSTAEGLVFDAQHSGAPTSWFTITLKRVP